MDHLTVGELGERRVLERVLAQLTSADTAVLGPGDDCAVLRLSGDAVLTSDTMIEGVDFRLDWHDGFSLGWKLAATNLSDVAAMGARPTALTASLACPRDTPAVLLEAVARGLTAACEALAPGCAVVGGDLGAAPALFAAITAVGELGGRLPVTRSGAKPGDRVVYAGQLGLSGLGFATLQQASADLTGRLDPATLGRLRADHPAALRAHLSPHPPIWLGVVAAQHGVTAMMDVSDGLALDAARLAEASGVAIRLERGRLQARFGEQAGAQVPIAQMLHGGEDHGLLATVGPDTVLPPEFRVIGDVIEGDRSSLVWLDGEPLAPCGWDPYASSSGS